MMKWKYVPFGERLSFFFSELVTIENLADSIRRLTRAGGGGINNNGRRRNFRPSEEIGSVGVCLSHRSASHCCFECEWMNEWKVKEQRGWMLMFIYAFEIHSLYLYLVTRQFLNLKCLNQIRWWYSSLSSSFHLIFTSQKSSL